MPDIPYRVTHLPNINHCDTIHTIIHVHKYDTVHTTVNVDVDSLIAYTKFRESLSDYSTMFNWALVLCGVVLAAFTLYSVIKFIIDELKIKSLEKSVDELSKKVIGINSINSFYSEQIIQVWLNLGILFGKKGDERFEYIAYMQVIDVLGKVFNREDFITVKASPLISRLKEIGLPDQRNIAESSILDEIDSIKRLANCLENKDDEFKKELEKLISIRLQRSTSKKECWLENVKRAIKAVFTRKKNEI